MKIVTIEQLKRERSRLEKNLCDCDVTSDQIKIDGGLITIKKLISIAKKNVSNPKIQEQIRAI